MVAIKATLFKFEFKRKEFSQAFVDGLFTQMRQAAREFARVAIEQVPIRTGFARGALRNLETAIGSFAATSPEKFLEREKTKFGKEKPPRLTEYYYHSRGNRTLKTPENARRFSTPPNKVFTVDGDVLLFNYNVTVLYYIVNEHTTSGVRNSPWQSFAKGREAFVSYMQDVGLKRLPAITSYTIKTDVVLDKKNVRLGKSSTVNKII